MSIMSNTVPFPHTPIRNPENYDENQKSGSESVTSTSRARAIMKVSDYYRATLGANIFPPRVQREVNGYLHAGVDPELICEALDEASVAPRPSWAYAKAIVERCIAEGVLTVDDFYERQIRWKSARR